MCISSNAFKDSIRMFCCSTKRLKSICFGLFTAKGLIEKVNQLKLEMEKFDKLHYYKYLFYYYNGLAINYNKLDKKKLLKPC